VARGTAAAAAIAPALDARLCAVPRVTIVADGASLAVEVPAGSTLFEAGAQASAMIETACVGKGTCGLCRVKILAGAEHLTPYTDEERKHLGNVYHLTRVRLACRSRLTGGDVTIQVVRKKKP
jgi:2Fe-2S ferredoxin